MLPRLIRATDIQSNKAIQTSGAGKRKMTPPIAVTISAGNRRASHVAQRPQHSSGHLAGYMSLKQKILSAPSQRSPKTPVAQPLNSSFGFNQTAGTSVFEEYTPPSHSFTGRRLILEHLEAGDDAQAARLAQLRQTLEEAPGEFTLTCCLSKLAMVA